MNRRCLEIITTTITAEEILGSGKYDPSCLTGCCGKFLIACDGGSLTFRCPGCTLPNELAEEALRRHVEENPPVPGRLAQVYPNW